MNQQEYARVRDAMLNRFMTAFGSPKVNNPDGFVAEFVRAVGSFSDAVLRRAADIVIDKRVYKGWPSIGDVVKACEAAKVEIGEQERQLNRPKRRLHTDIMKDIDHEVNRFVHDFGTDGEVAYLHIAGM